MTQKCAHFFPLEITLELEENCCWKFMCNGFLLFSIHIFGNSHKKENVMSLGAHFTRMKMFIFLGWLPKSCLLCEEVVPYPAAAIFMSPGMLLLKESFYLADSLLQRNAVSVLKSHYKMLSSCIIYNTSEESSMERKIASKIISDARHKDTNLLSKCLSLSTLSFIDYGIDHYVCT